jgi:hydroxymethylpyrimidine pyrophosphatase-like HAD family hydrolase
LLREKGFPRLDKNSLQEISLVSERYINDGVLGLAISPVSGDMVEFRQDEFSAPEGFGSEVDIDPLRLAEVKFYELDRKKGVNSIWSSNLIPIMGDGIYHTDGRLFDGTELEKTGFYVVKDENGVPLTIKGLVNTERVVSFAGPWVVPYVITQTGGEKLLVDFREIAKMAKVKVDSDNISQVLIKLFEDGKIHLKLAATLEFKGCGRFGFRAREKAPEWLRNLRGKAVYVPGLSNSNYGVENWPTASAIGALRESQTEHFNLQNQLLEQGAVFSGLITSTYKLFDRASLPEIEESADYQEVWMSQRVTFATNRASLYLYEWASDSGASFYKETLIPWLNKYYNSFDEKLITDKFLSRLYYVFARNIRAAFVLGVYRTSTTRLPNNWGPNLEFIDEGGLESVRQDWQMSEWDWQILYLETIVNSLISRESDDSWKSRLYNKEYFYSIFVPAAFPGHNSEEAASYFAEASRNRNLEYGGDFRGHLYRLRELMQPDHEIISSSSPLFTRHFYLLEKANVFDPCSSSPVDNEKTDENHGPELSNEDLLSVYSSASNETIRTKVNNAKLRVDGEYYTVLNYLERVKAQCGLTEKTLKMLKDRLILTPEFFDNFISSMPARHIISPEVAWQKLFFQARLAWFMIQEFMRKERPILLARNPRYSKEYTEFVFVDLQGKNPIAECANIISDHEGLVSENWIFDYEIFGIRVSVLFFEATKKYTRERFTDSEIDAIAGEFESGYYVMDEQDIEALRAGLKDWVAFCREELKSGKNDRGYVINQLRLFSQTRSAVARDVSVFLLNSVTAKERFTGAVNSITHKGLLPVPVADMDLTLTPSRQPVAEDMLKAITDILSVLGVFIIVTGSDKHSVDKYFLVPFMDYVKSKNIDVSLLDGFLVLACNGTQVFSYSRDTGNFENIYVYPLEEEIGSLALEKLIGKAEEQDNPCRSCILTETLKKFNIPVRGQNDHIDNRISQITFYGIGKKSTREERINFNDSDHSKRKPWREYIALRCLKEGIPVDLVIGGQTSIDILPRGIDKGYAIDSLIEFLGLKSQQMIFFGDSFTIFGNDRAAMLKVILSVNVGDAYVKDFNGTRKIFINAEDFGPAATVSYLNILSGLFSNKKDLPKFALDKSRVIGIAKTERYQGDEKSICSAEMAHPELNCKAIEKTLAVSKRERLSNKYIQEALDKIRVFDQFKYNQLVDLLKKRSVYLWQFELAPEFKLFDAGNKSMHKFSPPAIAVDHDSPDQLVFGYWNESDKKHRRVNMKRVNIFVSKAFADFCARDVRFIAYIAHMLLEIAGSRHKQALSIESSIAGKNAMGKENTPQDIFVELFDRFTQDKRKILETRDLMRAPVNKNKKSSSPMGEIGLKNLIIIELEQNNGIINLDLFSRQAGVSRPYLEEVIRGMRSITSVGEVVDIINPINYFRTGIAKTREAIHKDGDWHRTDHILGISEDGKRIALQSRRDKKKRGGLFVTGHFGVGEGAQQALSREFSEEISIIPLDYNRLYRVGSSFVKVGRRDFSAAPGYYKENKDGYNGKVYMYKTLTNDPYNREVSYLYVYIILKEEERLLSRGFVTEEVDGVYFLSWEEFLQDINRNPYGYHSAVWQYFSRPNIFKTLRKINFSEKYNYLQRELSSLDRNFHQFNGKTSSSPVEGAPIGSVLEEKLKDWFTRVDSFGNEKVDNYVLREIVRILDIYKKDFTQDTLVLFKKYYQKIINVPFAAFDQLLVSAKGNLNSGTEDTIFAVNWVICVFAKACIDAGEKDLFKDILIRVIGMDYLSDELWQKSYIDLNLELISLNIPESRGLLLHLIKKMLIKGYIVSEINSEAITMKLIKIMNSMERKFDYFLIRVLATLLFKDISGQVNVNAQHPLRSRTRQGNYGVGIFGVIRDGIHNNLGSYCISLLERYLEYLRIGDPHVLVNSEYQVDYFKGEKHYPLGLYPQSVYDEEVAKDLSKNAYAHVIRFLFAELQMSAEDNGKTLYEELRFITDSMLQDIYDKINLKLGMCLSVDDQIVGITGYVYAYRELCKRYNRFTKPEDALSKINSILQMRFGVGRFIKDNLYGEIGELNKAFEENGDYSKLVTSILFMKKKIRELVFNKEIKYDPENIEALFVEEWGRDDIGNYVGGSHYYDIRFALFMLDSYLTQLEIGIIPELISNKFSTINDANLPDAVKLLGVLLKTGYYEGLFPLSVFDYCDYLANPGISYSCAKDILGFITAELENTRQFLRNNLVDLAPSICRFDKKGRKIKNKEVLNYSPVFTNAMALKNRISVYLDGSWETFAEIEKNAFLYKEGVKHNGKSTYYVFGQATSTEELKKLCLRRDLLGAKGVGLVRAILQKARVPPAAVLPIGMDPGIVADFGWEALLALEEYLNCNKPDSSMLGRKFGDKDNPLLVSVRSAGYFTMPGQLPTIINVGLSQENIEGFIAQLLKLGMYKEDAIWTAWDSYRRFLESFATIVLGMPRVVFDNIIEGKKIAVGKPYKELLTAQQMKEICLEYKSLIVATKGEGAIPDDFKEQYKLAVQTVKDSWELSSYYRKLKNLVGDWDGTAIIVQPMLFGNIKRDSGSGVFYLRDEVSSMLSLHGDFKWAAQGEDLAEHKAAIEKLETILRDKCPWLESLREQASQIEDLLNSHVELEFTVQLNQVFILQVADFLLEPKHRLFKVMPYRKHLIVGQGDAMPVAGGACRGAVYIIDNSRINFEDNNDLARLSEEIDKVYQIALVSGLDGVIVISNELGPGQFVKLLAFRDEKGLPKVRGLLTERGGVASHVSDMAKEFGVSLIAGIKNIGLLTLGSVSIKDEIVYNGDILSISGNRGFVANGVIPLSITEFITRRDLIVSLNYFIEKVQIADWRIESLIEILELVVSNPELEKQCFGIFGEAFNKWFIDTVNIRDVLKLKVGDYFIKSEVDELTADKRMGILDKFLDAALPSEEHSSSSPIEPVKSTVGYAIDSNGKFNLGQAGGLPLNQEVEKCTNYRILRLPELRHLNTGFLYAQSIRAGPMVTTYSLIPMAASSVRQAPALGLNSANPSLLSSDKKSVLELLFPVNQLELSNIILTSSPLDIALEGEQGLFNLGRRIGGVAAVRQESRPANILFVGPPASLKSTIIGVIEDILTRLDFSVGLIDEVRLFFNLYKENSFLAFDDKYKEKHVVIAEMVTMLPRNNEVLDLFVRLEGDLYIRQQRACAESNSYMYAQIRTSANATGDYADRKSDLILNTDFISTEFVQRGLLKNLLESGIKDGLQNNPGENNINTCSSPLSYSFLLRWEEFIKRQCFTFRGWWGAFLSSRRGLNNNYYLVSDKLINTFVNDLVSFQTVSSSPIGEEDLLAKIITAYRLTRPEDGWGLKFIGDVYQIVCEEYKDKEFPDGEKYIVHAATTAYHVASLGGGALTIAISLMHKISIDRLKDVISVKLNDLDETARQYLYRTISKLQSINLPYIGNGVDVLGSPSTLQNYMRFIEQLAGGDHRVLLHICCDMAVRGDTKEERRIIARALFEIYVPLIERLNRSISTRLKDLAFQYTQPEEFTRTKTGLDQVLPDLRYDELDQKMAEVTISSSTHGIPNLSDYVLSFEPQAKIYYRKKGLYSIFEKIEDPKKEKCYTRNR